MEKVVKRAIIINVFIIIFIALLVGIIVEAVVISQQSSKIQELEESCETWQAAHEKTYSNAMNHIADIKTTLRNATNEIKTKGQISPETLIFIEAILSTTYEL